MLSEKGRALWLLAFMSPVIAELMSGSSPPLEFFNPLSLALLLGLYGSGVLIVRELAVIWNRGWTSILTMGAAYGILEEGVAVKSFFDPNWMDLGGLGIYGRFLETNWVWAVWLTVFHSVISITLPILILSILYPNLRSTRFLTGDRLYVVSIFLLLDVLVCTLLLNPYVPLWSIYMLAIAAVFGLVYYAKHIPKSLMAPKTSTPTWGPFKFFLLGIVLTLGNFFFAGLFVETAVPPIVPIVIILCLCAYGLVMIHEHIGASENRTQIVGLISGLMFFLVLFGVALQFSGIFGMGILAFIEALILVDLNLWARGRKVLVFRVGRLLHGA